MEMEYHDDSRKSRLIIVLGIILAVAAGAGVFNLVNQAQQQATGPVETIEIVVAARAIPEGQAIVVEDLAKRAYPVETVPREAVSDPAELIGRVMAVALLEGQPITRNLLASTDVGGQFSVLKPGESVAPDSPFWRAVAITVPAERAVAGLIAPGMSVDVFITMEIPLPAPPDLPGEPKAGDRSTRLAFQDIEILAKVGDSYIIRVPVGVAEEIEHLQVTGTGLFSLALRASDDTRIAGNEGLGATTTLIIDRYQLPIPLWPVTDGAYRGDDRPIPIPTPAPTPSPTPTP